jgi:NADH dehydrogenase (ubiquinone) 1 beta subcomplex subunit 9
MIGQLASPAHKTYVKRLFRKSLRLAVNWYWQRPEMMEKQQMIRLLFDANKNLTNLKEVEAVLINTEYLLALYHHQQPYISMSAPGGSKFERNLPFPEEVLFTDYRWPKEELLHLTITLINIHQNAHFY